MKIVLCAISLALTCMVANAAPVLVNGGFEDNNVYARSSSGYAYAGNFSAPAWSFAGGAGVSGNSTAWGGTASQGQYFAFLQNSAELWQVFDADVAGEVIFAFDLSQRGAWNSGGAQTVEVRLDGQVIETLVPLADAGWDAWKSYQITLPNIGVGQHLLSFLGTNLNRAADTAVFLDNVRVFEPLRVFAPVAGAVAPVPEPETFALMLPGAVLTLLLARRRKAQRT